MVLLMRRVLDGDAEDSGAARLVHVRRLLLRDGCILHAERRRAGVADYRDGPDCMSDAAARWDHILAQLAALRWLIHVDKLAATGKGKR